MWQFHWLHEIASADFFSLATTEGEEIASALPCLAMVRGVGKNRVDPLLPKKRYSASGDIMRTNILENLDYYRGGIKDVKHPCN